MVYKKCRKEIYLTNREIWDVVKSKAALNKQTPSEYIENLILKDFKEDTKNSTIQVEVIGLDKIISDIRSCGELYHLIKSIK